jgi:thiosulfate/3-mercaptopyruvate sulfurtransferase
MMKRGLVLALVLLSLGAAGVSGAGRAGGYAQPELLVETAELAARAERVRIIDVRPSGDYQEGHIRGAAPFDTARLRTNVGQASFLPTAAEFARIAGELGISNDRPVVIYDQGASARAARLWYVLDHYGHPKVALLNGGFDKWKKEGRAVTSEASAVARASFTTREKVASLCSADQLASKLGKKDVVILDVRSDDEYQGKAGRAQRKGHVPGAVNMEWKNNLTQAGTFKPAEELRALYLKSGVTPEKEVVTYCQSGGRASHTLFVLRLLGYQKARNYYGSWEEWGNRSDTTIEPR